MTTVLLVEDDADGREVLGRALRRNAYEVVAVADVPGAIAALARGGIDIVVTDMVLGRDETGGISVLQYCKDQCGWHPTIVVSAFAAIPVVVQSMNLGASYFLEKPFSTGDLLGVMNRLLHRKHDFSEVVARSLADAKLTEREREVGVLILKGLPSTEIARVLGVAEKTVRQHTSAIYAKFEVTSRAEFFHHVFPF